MSHTDISLVGSAQELSVAGLDSARLSNHLRQLQMSISELTRQKGHEELIQEKKMSYNQAMDVLYGRECGRRLDPMDRLPNEIITDIFVEVSDYSAFQLLELTMVSRKWYCFILSVAALWSHVKLGNRYDEAAILSLQIHLSYHLPFIMEISLPVEGWDSIRHLLLDNRHKIDSIHTSCPQYDYIPGHDRGIGALWKVLDDLDNLPNLRCLGFPMTYPNASYQLEKLLDRYSSLKCLTNVPLVCRDLQIAKDRLEIEDLITYDDIRNILPIVKTINCLKNVGLYSRPVPNAEEITLTHEHHWTNLSLYAYKSSFPSHILHQLSSLTRLEVGIDDKDFDIMASVLHKLQKLDLLRVSVEVNSTDIISPASAFFLNLNVQGLDLSIDEDERHSSSYRVTRQERDCSDR
ncbi:hypothetical protein CPB86DRAFT_814101 [Serendipita vermifera]|nr:hypothetical protein CPB86DRAFT_814101 [Serendipita vermifera]